MDNLEPPQALNCEGNLAESWRRWKQELTATEKDAKSDKVKTSILFTCIGKRGREVYNKFTFASEGDELKFKTVFGKLYEYCQPRKNLRHKFFTRKQKCSETFDDFITERKNLVLIVNLACFAMNL